ncbi:hypothetical protein AGA39_00015 [Escherichia coli]|nr:hypothetical protein AGA39_00015 [Escherichia coli]
MKRHLNTSYRLVWNRSMARFDGWLGPVLVVGKTRRCGGCTGSSLGSLKPGAGFAVRRASWWIGRLAVPSLY